ncbi:MAG TPA: Mth938-like domain-containing protein [Gammaproteobacteria bacterium]|nr:Mth938-like domain-containing protein [Gammaproteobacteria bacterium]
MPTLTLDTNNASYQIRSFKPGAIQINEKIFTQSLIIAPHLLIEQWIPQTIAELTAQTLSPILAMNPNIVLIGTGSTLIFPAMEVYGELINAHIGVEIMDTSAACRTYHALSSENRNVVAALIIR